MFKALLLPMMVLCVAPCFAQPGRRAAKTAESAVLNVDFSGQPLPTFRGGYLVGRQTNPAGYSIWDRSGQLLRHEEVRLPGVKATNIRDVSINLRGDTLVLVVTGSDAPGHFVSALAWGTPLGGISKMVPTESFAVSKIAFAADGTLWTFGRQYDYRFEEAGDYNTVRHYDRNGVFLNGHVPRSTFSVRDSKTPPSGECLMAVNGDRVGILSLVTSEWVEIGLDGTIIGRWALKRTPNTLISGAALTDKNELFLTEQFEKPSGGPTPKEVSAIVQLDKSDGSLREIDTSELRTNSLQGMLLLGAEAGRLIVRVKPPWQLQWIDIE
jgi:hypothetical protein